MKWTHTRCFWWYPDWLRTPLMPKRQAHTCTPAPAECKEDMRQVHPVTGQPFPWREKEIKLKVIRISDVE